MSILDGELAAIISDALQAADLPYPAVLTRKTAGSGPAHNPGAENSVSHACKGFVDDYAAKERDGTVIQMNDRKVIVLGPTLAIVPEPGDVITIRAASYRVISVKADPALATYELQGRA